MQLSGTATGTEQLSADKLLQVRDILGSSEFQKAMYLGFDCPQITDILVKFTVKTPGANLEAEVQGCVVPGDKSSASQLFQLITQP